MEWYWLFSVATGICALWDTYVLIANAYRGHHRQAAKLVLPVAMWWTATVAILVAAQR